MHALIIEDEALIAMQIEDVLREVGYETFTMAETEEDAVVAASIVRPDLIVSDVRLATVSVEAVAFDFRTLVLQYKEPARVPARFMSADPSLTIPPWIVRCLTSAAERCSVGRPFPKKDSECIMLIAALRGVSHFALLL